MNYEIPKHTNPGPAPGEPGHRNNPIKDRREYRHYSRETAANGLYLHVSGASATRSDWHEEGPSALSAIVVIAAFGLFFYTVGHTLSTIYNPCSIASPSVGDKK